MLPTCEYIRISSFARWQFCWPWACRRTSRFRAIAPLVKQRTVLYQVGGIHDTYVHDDDDDDDEIRYVCFSDSFELCSNTPCFTVLINKVQRFPLSNLPYGCVCNVYHRIASFTSLWQSSWPSWIVLNRTYVDRVWIERRHFVVLAVRIFWRMVILFVSPGHVH